MLCILYVFIDLKWADIKSYYLAVSLFSKSQSTIILEHSVNSLQLPPAPVPAPVTSHHLRVKMAAAVARFHQDDLITFSPGPPGADDHTTSSPTGSDSDLISFSPASCLPSGGGPPPAPKKWQNQVSNSTVSTLRPKSAN